MNAEQEEEFRQHRVRQAEKIKSEAYLHKVCCVCSSISRHSTAVCAVCKSYQWDVTPEVVIATADLAATFVFPSTLGYAPSFDREYEVPTITGGQEEIV